MLSRVILISLLWTQPSGEGHLQLFSPLPFHCFSLSIRVFSSSRDDPKDLPSVVASNSAHEGCVFTICGDNIFAAVKYEHFSFCFIGSFSRSFHILLQIYKLRCSVEFDFFRCSCTQLLGLWSNFFWL